MDILFLGDSLIEYFDWKERFPDHNIENLGMAGESVEGLLSRVIKIKGIYSKADFIFIMTGINNVAMDDLEFFDFYKIILEKLSSEYPNAQIFINSLLPTTADFISNESIHSANDSLKKLANDRNIEYLDAHKFFIDEDGRPVRDYLLDDGVHLSNKGYEVWSKILEGIINERHLNT
jgi:lysophospholipase L1-like esterase